MQVVQHNPLAQFSSRQLNITTGNKAKSMEKLSSGFKINRASDDAAGLSISEKMRWQIRGLDRASQNIEDGVSLVQVADGALEETSQMIRRIRELSVQAANDTNTPSDRIQIDNEIRQLKGELTRVFSDTEFNTRPIWDPNPINKVQIGSEYQQAVDMLPSTSSVTLDNNNKGTIPYSDGYRVEVQGTDPSDPSTYGFKMKWDAYDGNHYETKLIPFPADPESDYSVNVGAYMDTDAYPNLQGIDFTVGWHAHDDTTIEHIKNAIDGISYYNSVNSSETVVYSNPSGVSFSLSTPHLLELAMERDAEAQDKDSMVPEPNDGTSNVVSSPTYTDAREDAGWSFKMNFRNIGTVTAKSNSTTFYSGDRSPSTEGVWWEWGQSENSRYQYGKGYSSNTGGPGTLHSVTDTLLRESDPTYSLKNNTNGHGGTVRVDYALSMSGTYSYGGHHSSTLGTLSMSLPVSVGDTEEDIMNRIKGAINEASVIDFNPSGSYQMTQTVFPPQAKESLIEYPIYQGMNELNIQSGALEQQAIKISYESLNLYRLGLNDTNVKTYGDAQKAIQQCDDAMGIISGQRSYFGAMQNRLEHAAAVDRINSENTQSAESRIRDTDMAKEMVKLSMQNILSQAGESMLSQANRNAQGIMSLLQ